MTDTTELTVINGDLADIATSGLDDGDADERPYQEALVDAEEGTKVRFVGMQFNQLDDAPKLGDKVRFIVEGNVTGIGVEQMAGGHERHTAKVSVERVTRYDG